MGKKTYLGVALFCPTIHQPLELINADPTSLNIGKADNEQTTCSNAKYQNPHSYTYNEDDLIWYHCKGSVNGMAAYSFVLGD